MGRQLRPSGSAQAGFSLIELLVVIAVMAVLAVGVTLTPLGRSAPSDMARFRALHDATRDLAIAGRMRRGLDVTRRHMAQVTPGPDGRWQRGRDLRWSGPGAVLVSGGGPAGRVEPDAPDIRFLPDGRTEAFTISFEAGGRCESDGWTEMTCSGG